MGRNIMRVALDFEWPLDKEWEGYVNPHHVSCRWCAGRGQTERARRFEDFMRDLHLAGGESARRPADFATEIYTVVDAAGRKDRESNHKWHDLTNQYPRWPWPERDPVDTLVAAAGLPADWAGPAERSAIRRLAGLEIPDEFSRQQTRPMSNGHRYNYPHPNLLDYGVADPGARLHELTAALGWEDHTIASGGGWDAQLKVFKHVGIPTHVEKRSYGEHETTTWGDCAHCVDGCHKDHVAAYEAWEDYDPPAGEGWQVWETVSCGSPITPVLPTAEALVAHLVEHGTAWDQRRGERPTRAQAEAMVGQGGAMSAMSVGGKVMDSYEASEYLADAKAKKGGDDGR